MNPRLQQLQPYPFERMAQLKKGLTGNPEFAPIALSIGEPRHPPPNFVLSYLEDREQLSMNLAAYPATRGNERLRNAISAWLDRRFGARADPVSQILPVAGTREALFSFAQAMLSGRNGSRVVMPNPFYQIYEGAALLAGAQPYFVNCPAGNAYQPAFHEVPEKVWQQTELLFICSPGNPTGQVLPMDTIIQLIELAHRHDFIIASDECYSEIYLDEAAPPVGLLQAATRWGDDEFRRCMVFHSLSKRSNLPGLRSGFVAGDARLLQDYFLYRTYLGSTMGLHVQEASALAWDNEDHVVTNRAAYREKFAVLIPLIQDVLPDYQAPAGGFYCWLPTPTDDQTFAARLFSEQHITVLPGSFLSRQSGTDNPGKGHIRVAWVAPIQDCLGAARRLLPYLRKESSAVG